MVEYTDANPFKVLHIGHLYSNNVGESLARLLEASGADVKRTCYQGDVGLHVAKCLWGLKKMLEEEGKKFEDLYRETLAEKVKILGDAYMYGYEYYDTNKNPKAIEEIEKINRYIFSLFV
jgi:arginyl-tRNA synthetase